MRRRGLIRGLLAIVCVVLATPSFAGGDDEAAWNAFVERQKRLDALAGGSAKSTMASARVFGAGFEAHDASCDLDSDGDGLPDCVETDTGRYVDLTDTGTDPARADTDGDGLSDGDELLGTLDGLDLPALGVSPLRRDLLIEYDWFDDARECAAHSHAPSAAVLARVAAVFADAPVQNPDGSFGIHLIQDVGQGGALSGGNRVDDFDPVLPGTLDATYHAIKDAHFDPARRGVFRYVLLPHRYGGGSASSGYAEVVGDDAIVSLYCLNSEANVARTIMHEVGHLLGLHHGGYEPCNGKPNYNSIMNYRYQFSGVDDSCTASGDPGRDGFSIGERMLLDENAVDEHQGVCGNPPIDWNADGKLEAGIAHKLRPGYDAECGSALRTLRDFDDWANITLLGLRDANGALKSIQQHAECGGAPPPR